MLLKDEIGLCKKCQTKLKLVGENICNRCGKKLMIKGLCDICKSNKKKYKKRRSIYKYSDEMAELVHEFKYKNNKMLLKFFSKIVKNNYKNYFKNDDIDYIIPIPLSKKRKKQRGYNQAYELIKNIDEDIIKQNVLIRNKNTKPQSTYSNKTKRKKNVKNAFKVRKNLKNKNILLFDDLITTGATINEATKELKKNNAGKIYQYSLIRSR